MKIHNFDLEPVMLARDALQPDWSWNSNSNHWTGFHLWYITKNQVNIKTDDGEYNLSEGDTFLFDLSKNHHCTHDPQHPASMFTVYFHCGQTQLLQKLLRENTISRQNHPLLYNTNVHLFEQAMAARDRESVSIWLAPIFQQLLDSDAHSPGQHRIARIRQMMDTAPQERCNLDTLAAQAGYSKNQFIRIFRQATGLTPYAYLIQARILQAQNLLLFSDYSVTDIARMLGYNDLNHFSCQFHQKTGCYPSQYAARHRSGQTGSESVNLR